MSNIVKTDVPFCNFSKEADTDYLLARNEVWREQSDAPRGVAHKGGP
jgi:hypothetical protein